MTNAKKSPPHTLPKGETTIFVAGVSPAGFPERARAKTLLRSIAVLEEWLEQNEGRVRDEVRVRRIKRWRAEALRPLNLRRP
jgi:hypothetical protein